MSWKLPRNPNQINVSHNPQDYGRTIKAIHTTDAEVGYTETDTSGTKESLKELSKDREYRESFFYRTLQTATKVGRLSGKGLKGVLSLGPGLKYLLPAHLREPGVLGEFFNEGAELYKNWIFKPIEGIIKSKDELRAIIGELKARHLSDMESQQLSNLVSSHQDICRKFPENNLTGTEKKYESCKAVRDYLKSLVGKYQEKFGGSHFLLKLLASYENELDILEENKVALSDRDKIWKGKKERKSVLDSSKDKARETFEAWQIEDNKTPKDQNVLDTLKSQQGNFIKSEFQPKYEELLKSLRLQIRWLLESGVRKRGRLQPHLHNSIDTSISNEIAKLCDELIPYMDILGINTESSIGPVKYLDEDGNEQDYNVPGVINNTPSDQSIRIL